MRARKLRQESRGVQRTQRRSRGFCQKRGRRAAVQCGVKGRKERGEGRFSQGLEFYVGTQDGRDKKLHELTPS